MNIYRQPWRLVQNRVRGEGGREIDKFRGIIPPLDDECGSEAWVGSVTKALGANDLNPTGCAEVLLPDGRKEYLYRVIEENPEEILGAKHIECNGYDLGLLVKLLDAKESFALEAHPTRAVAKELWNSEYGKEESWYILGTREDTEEPAYVYLGFKEGVTAEIFSRYYEDRDMEALENLCHKIRVKKGDIFMIGAGLPHALGAGCLALEVQEPSDVGVTPLPQSELAAYYASCGCEMKWDTEEVYKEKILKTFIFEGRKKTSNEEKWHIPERIIRKGVWGKETILIGPEQTSYFSYTKLDIYDSEVIDIYQTGFPQIAIVIDGKGVFQYNGGEMEVKKADEIFLPYNIPGARIKGNVSIIFCHPEGALKNINKRI